MTMKAKFARERKAFHASLLGSILTRNAAGVVSNADGSNPSSRKIAEGIADFLEAGTIEVRMAGQTSGMQFEAICTDFVHNTFMSLMHLRPGRWKVRHITSRNRLEIASFEQYAHLTALHRAAKLNPELAAILGSDYTISPDIIISREPEEDSVINAQETLVDETVTQLASLRKNNGNVALLHASISCKWTIRSDRSQNARSEAQNLIRNRKGHLPHVVVITAEPLPSRLESIALGTGDIDCVYHFALYELIKIVNILEMDKAKQQLDIMIDGKRLKDISDLPLDLVV